MWRFLPGVFKVSASKKIPLLITARQQRSAILANTEIKKKLVDTDDEGMISGYESEPEMSGEYVLKYFENELGNSTETLQTFLN